MSCRIRTLFVLSLLALLLWPEPAPAAGAPAGRQVPPFGDADAAAGAPPFTLPFAGAPGPSSWYLIQGYGNTLFAYYQRYSMYRAGQGLHFGLDFAAPCGTPVLAIGDGVVAKVDAPEHKALPHNLMIRHSNGYASFYGHLLQRPDLRPGDVVTRGHVIALSGDSYGTCHSAPHLHLEIRDWTYREVFNPVPLIAADWNNIGLALPTGLNFAHDADDPGRWQYLDDQPEVLIGGPLLNDYQQLWPLEWR
jgi:murein DD-endopeptidase MepM/ murein hydrolase activator NlpD